MKSRRSLGSSIAVDAVVKQSNKRRKSVDAKLISDVVTEDNHCDNNNDNNNDIVKENKENEDTNKKKYMLRSPGLKKARHSFGVTAAPPSMRDMDESTMMEKKGGYSRRTTANPNDLFDLLHDLADATCLSINSEDMYEKSSNNHPLHAAASSEQQQQTAADESARSQMQINSSISSINKTKVTNSKGIIKPKIMMISRRKTFDGVITDSFLKENDDDDDNSSGVDVIEASAATKKLPDRRATLDPSELLLSVYHDVHMEHEHETGSL